MPLNGPDKEQRAALLIHSHWRGRRDRLIKYSVAAFKYLFVAMVAYVLAFVVVNLMIYTALYSPPTSNFHPNESNYVALASTDGHLIAARWLPKENARCAILYSHGNAMDLSDSEDMLALFNDWGFSALSYDYQGYGISQGKPSEKNTYDDILASYQYLTQVQGLLPEHIILYGSSLGTGPTLEVAQHISSPAAIILEAPFMSVYHVATWQPLFPFNQYVNVDKISTVRSPILIIHGLHDTVIPIRHGRALFERAPADKKFLLVANAGHNDLYYHAEQEIKKTLLSVTPGCF